MRIHRLALIGLIVGCRTAGGPGAPSPTSSTTGPAYERGITPRPAPPLPSIPLVDGPLAPKLVFPEANQAISVREDDQWEADRIVQIEQRFTQWLAS